MSARILHVGADFCHRVEVLESAGYRVSECRDKAALECALKAVPPPDAVVLIEDYAASLNQAFAMIEEHALFPVIYFGDLPDFNSGARFELVIPCLSSPDTWLVEIAELIAAAPMVRIAAKLPVQAQDANAFLRTSDKSLYKRSS